MSVEDRILLRMYRARRPLAIHEFDLEGISQNNLGTRLPEVAKTHGFVTGATRPGEHFKEWDLTPAGRELAFNLAAQTAAAAQPQSEQPGAPA